MTRQEQDSLDRGQSPPQADLVPPTAPAGLAPAAHEDQVHPDDPRLIGHIRLHRKILASQAWAHRSPAVYKVWSYCCMMAAFAEHATPLGNDSIILGRGQFVTGRRKMAAECHVSEQNVKSALRLLKKWQNLTTKSTNAGTIITICNYNTYQYSASDANTPSNPRPTHGQPTANHYRRR